MPDLKLSFPEINLSNFIDTAVIQELIIPQRAYTPAGEIKRMHKLALTDTDVERLRLLIPLYFNYREDGVGRLAELRAALFAAMAKENVLTYNRDPDETGDVYIDTYPSLPPAHNQNEEHFGGMDTAYAEILCDPFARSNKEQLLGASVVQLASGDESWQFVSGSGSASGSFDSSTGYWASQADYQNNILSISIPDALSGSTISGLTNGVILAQDGYPVRRFQMPVGVSSFSGNWSCPATLLVEDFLYHSASQGVALYGNAVIGQRSGSFSLDLSTHTTGKCSFWAGARYNISSFTLRVKIGQSASNYYFADVSISLSANIWTNFQFTLSSMSAVGAPSWASPITFFRIEGPAAMPGTNKYFAVDDFTVVRSAPTPFIQNLNVSKGDFYSPVKMCLVMDDVVDNIWIGRKADNVNAAPLVVNAPTATSGWNVGAETTGQSDCLNGDYWSVSVNSTEAKVFPARFALNTCTGVYKVFARFKSLDPGTITVRRAAQDKNGIVQYGDSKSFATDTSNWRIGEFGDLSVPLTKPTSDAALQNLFTTVGLAVKGSAGTAYAFRVDWIALLAVDGGSVYIALPSGVQYLIYDTITRDGGILYGSTDGTDDNSYSLRQYMVGDLEALEPGDNTLAFLAYNSAAPNAVRTLQLSNLYHEPRYDLLRKL